VVEGAARYLAAKGEVLEISITLMLGVNLGLATGTASCNGTFKFGFTSDPRLMSDVETFADKVVEAFTELSQEA
jgi:hypothetical protein